MTTDAKITIATLAPTRDRRAKTSSAAVSIAPTKSDTVIKLLLRARGATPLELIAATDWQAHSIRAFLSGLRKKGRLIVREARKSGEFAYRIEASAAASAEPEAARDNLALDTADA